MRKLIALVLIFVICLLPVAAGAARSKAPKPVLMAVFGATNAGSGAPVSMEITAAVTDQLVRSGRVEVVAFNPEMPSIARAILEKRLQKQAVDEYWLPKNANQIAQVLKTEYALCVTGVTDADKATVNLELVKVPSGGDWKTNADSVIITGPRVGTVRSNAILTASSSAVSQIILDAFGDSGPLLPDRPKPEPSKPVTPPTEAAQIITPAPTADAQPTTVKPSPTKDATTALAVPVASSTTASPATSTPATPTAQPAPTTEPTRDAAADYNAAMRRADGYLIKKDMRNAALELRNAINLDPLTPSARVKLAGVYSDLGMTDDAIDECKRALLFSKDSPVVYNMLVKLYLAGGRFAEAADQSRELVRLDPNNVEARIALGDICWNQAKIDDAAAAYQEAVKLDPKNTTAHTRLQRLFTARKMYPQSLEQLLAVKVPSAEAEPNASKRYTALAAIIQDEFAAVQDTIDGAQKDFDQGKIAREDFYQDCKDAASRIDALASYLSAQTAPSSFKEGNSHGVLATSLLSQASGYLVTFMETDKQYYKEQALLLENEAKTEIALFAKAVNKNG